MSAKAGEIARETAPYRCCDCSHELMVRDGRPIPDCPSCGNESFHTGGRTLQNRPAETAYAL